MTAQRLSAPYSPVAKLIERALIAGILITAGVLTYEHFGEAMTSLYKTVAH